MPVTIKRTVIVGLGGTGTRALQYIKGEFKKHFGGIPSAIKLLAFDTAPQRASRSGALGSSAELGTGEFVHITATGIRRLLQAEEIQNWAPPLEKWDLQDILDGAGQRRASGRLALFCNAVGIYNALNNAIGQVKSMDLVGDMEGWQQFEVPAEHQTTTEVYVIGSFAGGTGSGLFLDIGYMIRQILTEEGNNRVTGVFLLPGVFRQNLAATDFVAGNGYAALRELDHWLNESEEHEVRYPGMTNPVTWGGAIRKPFSFIYLLDDVNEGGEVVRKVETMLYFIARGVFLHMTVQSTELAAFWANLAGILQASDNWKGKIPRYMSFGISSLQIPLESHIDQNVNEILIEKLEELRSEEFTVAPEALGRKVSDFLSDMRLDVDSLIERLNPQDFRWDVPTAPDKPWTKTGEIQPWKDRALRALDEVLQAALSEHGETFQVQRDEMLRSLSDHVKRLTLEDEAGHLRQAEKFTERLASELKQLRSSLEVEEGQLAREIEAVSFDPVESATGGMFVKKKVERLINDYQQSLGKLADLKRRQKLLHLAGVLVGALVVRANQIQDEIKRFDKHLERTLTTLRIELDRMQAGQGAASDDTFATILREEDVSTAFAEKSPIVGLDMLADAWEDAPEAYEPVSEEGGVFDSRTVFGWRRLSHDHLSNWLKRQVKSNYEDLLDQDIDSIISKLWAKGGRGENPARAKLQKRLQEFMDKARPLWRVEVEPDKRLQYLLLMGICERENQQEALVKRLIEGGELVTSGEIQKSTASHHFASTWERFAIRALRIGVPAPAYALNKMDTYRNEYLRREAAPDSRVTHHIHRDWIGGAVLADLFPEGMAP